MHALVYILFIGAALAGTAREWREIKADLKQVCEDQKDDAYCELLRDDVLDAIDVPEFVDKLGKNLPQEQRPFVKDTIGDFAKGLKHLYNPEDPPKDSDKLKDVKKELKEKGEALSKKLQDAKDAKDAAILFCECVLHLMKVRKEHKKPEVMVDFLHPLERCFDRLESIQADLKAQNKQLYDEDAKKVFLKLKEARERAYLKITPLYRRPSTIIIIVIVLLAIMATIVVVYLFFSLRKKKA
jgi:hypothetical protein